MATTINADTSDGLKLTADASGEIDLQSAGVTQAKITSSGLQNASGNPITSQSGKNLIINGNMQIAQRATSVTGITSSGGAYFTVDRFAYALSSGGGTWTQSQEADAPEGFGTSLKLSCTATGTFGATTNWNALYQPIEGFNLQQLKYGTANAESLTVSFWVKSNKTGTYSILYYASDNARAIASEYTILSANTWEKKTITIVGDTSGIINNDNGTGLSFYFTLASGSLRQSNALQTSWGAYDINGSVSSSQVQLGGSVSDYLQITGVQLEANTTATPFEYLQYGQQLALCQRYYFVLCNGSIAARQSIGIGAYYSSSDLRGTFSFPTTMRATPTLEVETVTDGYDFRRVNGVDRVSSFALLDASLTSVNFNNNTNASGTAGTAGELFSDDVSAFLAVSAEL